MAKIGKKEAALKEARAELQADNDKLAAAFNDSLGNKGPFGFKGGKPSKAQVEKKAKEIADAAAKEPAKRTAKEKKLVKGATSGVTDISLAELNMAPGVFDPKSPTLAKEVADAIDRVESKKKTAAKPVGKPGKAAKAPAKGKTAPEKKPAGKAPSPKAKPSKEGLRPDGLREGSKQAVMLDMVKRKEGASEKEICKKLGWKKCRVTVGRVVKRVGLKLTHKRVDDVTIYFAS